MNNQSPDKPDFDPDVLPLSKLYVLEQFVLLRPLVQRIQRHLIQSSAFSQTLNASISIMHVRLSAGNVDVF